MEHSPLKLSDVSFIFFNTDDFPFREESADIVPNSCMHTRNVVAAEKNETSRAEHTQYTPRVCTKTRIGASR